MIAISHVMTRPEHLREAQLSAQDVETLLDGVVSVSEHVRFNYLWRPILPDADDDMVLETAINGSAAALVTFNRRDFAAAEQQFGIDVLLPGEVVERMEKRA
jgi:predicted nucleic acid-binding protein